MKGLSGAFAIFWLLFALLPVLAAAASSPCIEDDSGSLVELSAPARRILPLYAALSENLVAMGLDDRLVGRTLSDDVAPGHLPTVGTHMRPNLELISGVKPDLVLLLEGREEAGLAALSLQRLGIPVARFRIASFPDLFSCLERLGILCGEPEAAARLTADIHSRLEAVERRMAIYPRRPTVFFEIRHPNLLGAGGGNMLTDIIRKAGGENILSGYPERMVRLSEEMLVLRNPDIYLIQQGPMNKSPAPLESRPHFRELGAARNRLCYMVPEESFSRPGPQSVAAVETLSGFFIDWHERNNPLAQSFSHE